MRKIDKDEYVRINKALARKEEMEKLGPGFHSKHSVHKSRKNYSRKEKHQKRYDSDGASFLYKL